MRLILLLSAFLTALVGQGTSARAAVPAPCAVTAIKTVAPLAVRVALTVRAPETASQDRVNFAGIAEAIAPVRGQPLYADRLLI